MRKFIWCPEIAIAHCLVRWPVPHSHICIRDFGDQVKTPQCGNPALYVDFYDLDPEAIRRTQAFADDPVKGQKLIDGCISGVQAEAIVEFVEHRPDEELIVVNCGGGVSRSPGVVLALRRHYGGDAEECFRKAIPNIYVASMVTQAFKRGVTL